MPFLYLSQAAIAHSTPALFQVHRLSIAVKPEALSLCKTFSQPSWNQSASTFTRPVPPQPQPVSFPHSLTGQVHCSFGLWHFIIPIRLRRHRLGPGHCSHSHCSLWAISFSFLLLFYFLLFIFHFCISLFFTPILPDDCSKFMALDCVLTFIHAQSRPLQQ